MSAAYLRAWFERVERSREERKAITDHERGLFTEAKSHGFDGKALRKVLQRRAMGDAALAELDALVDAYEAALGGKAMAAGLMAAGVSGRQAAKIAGIGEGTARRAKNMISGAPRSEVPPSPANLPGAGNKAALMPTVASDTQPPAGGLSPHVPPGAVPAASPLSRDVPAGGTETDRAATSSAPEGPAEGEKPPRPDPDASWQARDAAGNYSAAIGAMRERHVASGTARLDAGDIPAFLDRRGRA